MLLIKEEDTQDIIFQLQKYKNIMLCRWQKLFDQTIKNDIKTYENTRKIAAGQRDDYTTGCMLDYNYFIKHHKMIAIDLSK